MKYHPDKNDSKNAGEVFKKITHAFSVLSDKEKKAFYDKYGDENEARERFTRTYHRRYDEEDEDVFNVFNMFFGGEDVFGNAQRQRMRQRAQQEQEQEHAQAHEQRQNVRRNPHRLILMQLLPLILLALITLIPYFFNFVR